MTTPQEPKGEEMLLEVFVQKRQNPETKNDEFFFLGQWGPFERINTILEAGGLKIGNMYGDVPLSEVPANVQAQLEGEIRKLHPNASIEWGEPPDAA